METPMPVIRNSAFYPGQMGVPGAAPKEGLRSYPRVNAYYVDKDASNADDNNDGTHPDFPMATIAAAVAAVTLEGDVIYVMPGTYSEAVSTPNSSDGPNYVQLIGVGNGGHTPIWGSGSGTAACLTLKATGWRVSGFRFNAPNYQACIQMANATTPYTANDVASRSRIDGNRFEGADLCGGVGIDFNGAPAEVVVENNIFIGFDNAGACVSTAILASSTATACPLHTIIENNKFLSGDNYINLDLDVSIVRGNIFMMYNSTATTIGLDARGGGIGHNLVTFNYINGTYTNAGGFYANDWADSTSISNWGGNWANDSEYTLAVPS